jgi:hypothetical protein
MGPKARVLLRFVKWQGLKRSAYPDCIDKHRKRRAKHRDRGRASERGKKRARKEHGVTERRELSRSKVLVLYFFPNCLLKSLLHCPVHSSFSSPPSLYLAVWSDTCFVSFSLVVLPPRPVAAFRSSLALPLSHSLSLSLSLSLTVSCHVMF